MHTNEHPELGTRERITNAKEEESRREERWMEVDRLGKLLCGKQGELDVEIGDWLIAARDEQVHQYIGYASLLEYVERRIGLTAHAALERLRVADSLTVLPEMRASLRSGALHWSVVRELSRVAVPETEREWLQAASGRTTRDAQQLVSGRVRGQSPGDPADPRLRRYGYHQELGAEAYATVREAVRSLQKELGPGTTEEQALLEMARRALRGPGNEGRAPYQIALTRCESCDRVWQDARGEQVEVPAEVLERASCDAQHIGRVDGSSHEGHVDGSSHVGRTSKRASQTIPPAVRREVLRRDGGRCKVPSCRNASWLEIHHLWPRSEGGPHDPAYLATTCSFHHGAIHAGVLFIEGDSVANLRFVHADGTPYGQPPDVRQIDVMTNAFSALRNMGFKETETKRALATVQSHGGREQDLEGVLRSALHVLSGGMA